MGKEGWLALKAEGNGAKYSLDVLTLFLTSQHGGLCLHSLEGPETEGAILAWS